MRTGREEMKRTKPKSVWGTGDRSGVGLKHGQISGRSSMERSGWMVVVVVRAEQRRARVLCSTGLLCLVDSLISSASR